MDTAARFPLAGMMIESRAWPTKNPGAMAGTRSVQQMRTAFWSHDGLKGIYTFSFLEGCGGQIG